QGSSLISRPQQNQSGPTGTARAGEATFFAPQPTALSCARLAGYAASCPRRFSTGRRARGEKTTIIRGLPYERQHRAASRNGTLGSRLQGIDGVARAGSEDAAWGAAFKLADACLELEDILGLGEPGFGFTRPLLPQP